MFCVITQRNLHVFRLFL